MKKNGEILYNQKDLSTLSNPLEALSTKIALVWDIDFDRQIISGSVEHVVQVVKEGTTHVDFDSSKIAITGDVLVNGEVGVCKAADPHPVLGTKLSVSIPMDLRKAGTLFTVLIPYSISTEASAMQWLTASATKGGKHPYLFTQSQAIHARSLLPCMDSPGVKTTYTARVSAPLWCTVLMSALADSVNGSNGNNGSNGVAEGSGPPAPLVESGKNVFLWNQPVPVSAYLIALAAGRMESREISSRVRVWAEPEVVDAALFEFSETEDFVQAAENLTGCAYLWTRYDILCLPPSFPYGGMENPCLTFATPTLLAGDRSLADVIAHEIAHSWTGNLVTNHTWDHFWLNEGWTVWLERKITSKVRGDPEVGKLSSQIGWKHLQDDVNLLGAESPSTKLVWCLGAGEDPDDAYSSVPYEKGCNLLQHLEGIVGSAHFESFLKSYIATFKYKTVTSGHFRDHFMTFFKTLADKLINAASASADASGAKEKGKKGRGNQRGRGGRGRGGNSSSVDPAVAAAAESAKKWSKMLRTLDWNKLLLTTGMPTILPDFSNSLSAAAQGLAQQWIALAEAACNGAAATSSNGSSAYAHPVAEPEVEKFKTWSAQQKNVFLETLSNYASRHEQPPEAIFPPAFLKLLDETYKLSESKNSEIMLRWQSLCLLSEADWIVPHVAAFITSQGRMKFARPLYRALRSTSVGRDIAIKTFEKYQDIYHPIARKMIAADLKKAADLEGNTASDTASDAASDAAGDNDAVPDTAPATIAAVEVAPAIEESSSNTPAAADKAFADTAADTAAAAVGTTAESTESTSAPAPFAAAAGATAAAFNLESSIKTQGSMDTQDLNITSNGDNDIAELGIPLGAHEQHQQQRQQQQQSTTPAKSTKSSEPLGSIKESPSSSFYVNMNMDTNSVDPVDDEAAKVLEAAIMDAAGGAAIERAESREIEHALHTAGAGDKIFSTAPSVSNSSFRVSPGRTTVASAAAAVTDDGDKDRSKGQATAEVANRAGATSMSSYLPIAIAVIGVSLGAFAFLRSRR